MKESKLIRKSDAVDPPGKIETLFPKTKVIELEEDDLRELLEEGRAGDYVGYLGYSVINSLMYFKRVYSDNPKICFHAQVRIAEGFHMTKVLVK